METFGIRFKFSKKSVLLTMLCKFINRKKDVNMQKEMLNFDYYNPTHIIFGKNRFNELNEVIPQDKKSIDFVWWWKCRTFWNFR